MDAQYRKNLKMVLEKSKEYTDCLYTLATNNKAGDDTEANILAKTSDSGIWVGSDTGHWYYWNGTQYVDGGVYQAIQIANGSVTRAMLNDTATSYYLNNITPTAVTRNATATISHNNFDYSLGYQTSDTTGYFGLSFKLGTYANLKNGNALINIKSISGIDGIQLLIGKNEGNWTIGTYGWNPIYITKAGIYTIPIKNDNIASDSDNIWVFIKKEFAETSNINGTIDFNIGYAWKPLNDKLNCALLDGKTKDDLVFGDYYNNSFPVIMPSSVIRNSTLRYYGVSGYEYPFYFIKNNGAGYFAFFVNIGTYGTIKNKKLLVDLTSMGGLPVIDIFPCSTSYDWSGGYNNKQFSSAGKYIINLKKTSSEPSDNTTIYLVFRNEKNYENTIQGVIKSKMCFLDDTMQLPNAYTLNGFTSDDFVKNIISTDVICWGDSLTAGAGGNGTTYETVIASLLNCNVLNCGVGGEKAETIALRQGGLKGIIPAGNGTSFNILNPNYNTNSNYAPLKQGQGNINPITIDGTEYTLTKNNDDTYSISGYSSTVNKPFKTYGSTLKGKVTIIWVGTNNGGISDSVIDVIDNMISVCGNDKYIVMGLTSDNETSDYDKLLSHFGTHFFNTRKEIIENWVAISGLTPTSDDNTRTSNNLVPSSLLSDAVHFNATGYTVIGTLLSYRIKELLDSNGNEYLSAKNGTKITDYVDNAINNLRWELGSHTLDVTTDSDTSFSKSVPSGALGCQINKLGGMSYKSINIWDEQWELGSISTTNGTNVISDTQLRAKNQFRITPNTTYYFKGTSAYFNAFYYDINGNFISYSAQTINNTFTTPNNVYYMRFNLLSAYGTTYNNDICINVSNASINGTYYPYFEDIRNSPVTSVVSNGANLWDEQWELGTILTSTGENSPSTTQIRSVNYIPVKPSTTYYNKGYALTVYRYDVNKTFLGYSTVQVGTFTLDADTYYIRFWRTATIYNNDIMIVKGSTAPSTYLPYVEPTTYPIPSQIRALTGYGWGVNNTCYNYIDFETKNFVKKVGRIDLGTLTWALDNNGYFRATIQDMKIGVVGETFIKCSKYDAKPTIKYDSQIVSTYGDKIIVVGSIVSALRIVDTTYTDAQTFKSAMSGVYLIYELETPIETDISNYIINDTIDVEPLGTLEFTNTYSQDVPSDIDYLIEEVKA